MNKKTLKADILLLFTSAIWGFAFVAQRTGMEFVGPFTYNAIRFLIGSFSLIPLIVIFKNKNEKHSKNKPKSIILLSGIAGTCLFMAVSLQQMGLLHTTAGNSGFITGLYVVLTPIFGIFLGRKTGIPTWIGATFTLIGLFFLSVADYTNSINIGDILTAISAIFWAFHVLIIDRIVHKVDSLMLSCGQFLWCSFFSFIVVFFKETISLAPIMSAIIPILYGGFCSVGIAYTLQVIAQKTAPPAHATIIMCLEGVFAAIGGIIILSESLGTWTLLAFILMFCGMIATQWEVIKGKPT